jgi:hypothetical protein
LEELGFGFDQMPYALIEAIILAVRHASSMLHSELEEQIYGYRLDEETKTA